MNSTETPLTDIKHSIAREFMTRSSNDSEDVFHPANESPAPANTNIMDTGDDETLIRTPSDSRKPLHTANKSSTVSSSISIDSRTSTLKYSQEPFDQYRVRVEALCHILWPNESRLSTPERRVSGVAKSRILDAVRVKKLRRFLSPFFRKRVHHRALGWRHLQPDCRHNSQRCQCQ